ncbi:uncharacterized protein LOC121367469 [Gigantopelta aegis]|uniref:uncharacterized protein LOC121367469 n=1 Tax=Gigantopelta aegis TaxID=1735272 RepID=UPI001B8894F2|nr:uncharacterized protein LOC121367469 [Gigantopelta aegis]
MPQILLPRSATCLRYATGLLFNKPSICLCFSPISAVQNSVTNVTVRHIALSRNVFRVLEVPSATEASMLKRKFENPRQIIHKLLQPLVTHGGIPEPFVKYLAKLNGQYWKARLQVKWPYDMMFTGVHKSITVAEENAYLQACQLYSYVGLIYEDSHTKQTAPVTEQFILKMLDVLYQQSGIYTAEHLTSYRITTTRVHVDDDLVWHAELQVPWPHPVIVTSTAPTMRAAQYSVCLQTWIKLKFFRLLTGNNLLNVQKLPRLSERLAKQQSAVPLSKEEFDPDYELFVDSSRVGFGAYLLAQGEDKVRWLSDFWPDHFNEETVMLPEPKFYSSFYEYYALVAACYTWKHKFVNKKVLCWSDNMMAVGMVNMNPYLINSITMKPNGKLYRIMVQMCLKYNIRLQALHLNREENTAADMLSRVHVEKFREVFPEADEKSKKIKKLLFWKPIYQSNSINLKCN